MIRVIVAGSRTFTNYEFVEKMLKKYFKEHNIHKSDVEIISGTARGADQLGEQFAEKYGLKLTKFPADWNNLGKKAGIIRNIEMVKYAIENEDNILFAFWDGQSRGTQHIINESKKYNIKTLVYTENE